MIDERELTRLVEQLANSYEVPERGRQEILDAAGQETAMPSPVVGPTGLRSRPGVLLPAAAVVAVFAIGAAVLSNLGQSQTDTATLKSVQVGDEAGSGGGSRADGPGELWSGRDTDSSTASRAQRFRSGGPVAAVQQEQAQPQASTAAGAARTPAAATAATAAAGQSAPDAGARVIKTGEVQVEVGRGRFGTVIDRLTSLAASRGGFVAQTETSEGDAAPSGTVTLRVPAAEFDAVVGEVRRLGKVVSATSRGQDVSAQYTDIEARLRGLNASRDQILTVLSKATTVGDILAVQERLNSVQVQIEQLQGQQKVLDDRTTFGTLAVRVAEPGSTPIGYSEERSGLSGAWRDARRGFGNGLEAIVAGSGTALILALALAVLALAGRAVWLVTRRRLI